MKKRIISLLLAVVLLAASGCASQEIDQSTPTPDVSPSPTPFTYTKDIWSERKDESRQAIIDKLVQDIADTGFPLDLDDCGIIFTQSTLEEGEHGLCLVVRGFVKNAETNAGNFVKLKYSLGDALSQVGALDRGDDVENAKFFCDLADDLGDLKLDNVEINTQIDAWEFYENYEEDMKYGLFTDGKDSDALLQLYNGLTNSDCQKITDIPDMNLRGYVEQDITFVGEARIEKIDNDFVGRISMDVFTRTGWMVDISTTFTDYFRVSRYSNDIYFLEYTSASEMDAVDLINNISNTGPMDVSKENYGVSEIKCGSYRNKDGEIIFSDNGVLLSGQEALDRFNRHDWAMALPDKNIIIEDLSMYFKPTTFYPENY